MSENSFVEKKLTPEASGVEANNFDYSDGDDAEDYLLRVISNAKDISLGSAELAAAIRDWPSEYHLSPIRGNLLKGFDFPSGASVLEIGAGCGAITRFLGETGLAVTAVEGSSRRAKIASQRCRDLANVRVVTSNITDFKTKEKFDFVFLIGVLEYSPSFIQGADPVQQMLSVCQALLKKDGVLVIAIENRLGLKYLNGAPEDHIGRPYWGVQDLYVENSQVTFGRKELCSRLAEVGFSKVDSYFPFPDYKLPEVVVSQSGLDSPQFRPGELLHQNYSGGNGQTYLACFDEPLTWSVVGANGLIGDLANSFLLFASRKKLPAQTWLAKTFSARGTLTSFLDSEGAICVEKSGSRKTAPGPFNLKSESAQYVTGKQYHNELRRILVRGEGVPEVAALLRPWFDFLCNSTTTEGEITKRLLPHDFVDCVPYNIVVNEEGEFVYIDREWIGVEAPPFAWIFIRGVLHAIWRCGWKGALVNYTYRQAINEIAVLLGLSLTDQDFSLGQKLESQLFHCASGGASPNESPLDHRIENTIQFWREDFSRQLNLLSRAKLEIDSRDAQLAEGRITLEHLEQMRKERDLLETQRSSLIQERDSLIAERDFHKRKISSQAELIESERTDYANSVTTYEKHLADLSGQVDSAHEKLNQVFSSKSWKVTAPLRKLRVKRPLTQQSHKESK